MIKRILAVAVWTAILFVPSAPAYALVQNVLGNPGFETDLGVGANWNNTANRGITTVAVSAPEGRQFLRLDETVTVNAGFAGVFTFQVATGVNPGDVVAFSGLARAVALGGGEEGQLRIEFQTSAGALISGVNTSISAVSANFTRVSVSGTAPAGTSQVAFVLRIQPSTAGDVGGTSQVDFDDMIGTVNALPILLNAGASSGVHNAGDLTMVSVQLQNISADILRGLELVATPTPGLDIHPEQSLIDGKRVNQHEGSVVFTIGNLSGGQDSLFAFAVLLSSGIVPGKRYEISLFARTSAGTPLSDIARVVIDVEPDPLFHLGTIIGKVFNDANENAMQDPGEKGIHNVRIATEQGVVVYTDPYGRYHIPGVSPGRHVVKVDYHSLPEGTQFVTEESYLTKITEGLLAKVNFAVKLPKDEIPQEFQSNLNVNVIQELDRTKPELTIDMDPPVLKAGQGMLERPVVFKLHTNYGNLLKEWRVEVRDELGQEVWSGLGKGAPPAVVRWDGKDNSGNLIEAGDYSLRLIVSDTQDHEDWTALRFFRVLTKVNPWKNTSENKPFAKVGYFDLMSDGKRSIPLAGRTAVRVQGTTPSKNSVLINNQPIVVDNNGRFATSMFVPDGQQKIEVSTTTDAGETLSYQKQIEIKENYMFMVGLGEEQVGANNFKGNFDVVAKEDTYKDGFYQDGRVAYYLKGKIKGKFLVSSSYDSTKNNKWSDRLFTNLDPDKYYPVYGDGSELDYSASETQKKFYVLIEKDKSFLQYGSFNSDFTDTELTTHNRTMSGAKVHFQTLNSTRYGDPKTSVSGFHSEQQQLPDHNEFVGTGGSLFYLRKRLVVEGSDKVRIEVRDKLTGVILSRRDLASGADYEIDYDQGRLILKKPLSSVVESDTIINQKILEGNSNVLVIDYEYKESRVVGFGSSGLRGTQHFSDFVKVGATYIEDKHPPNNRNYAVRGADTTVRLGNNTKVTAEYAEAENTQLQGYSSVNGGLTFLSPGSANLSSPEQGRNGAYVVRVQSRPIKKFDISAYVQKYNPFFNNADTAFSQNDFKKLGAEANYRMSNNFTLRYRQDYLHREKKNLFVEQPVADLDRAKFHTFQAIYDGEQVLAIGEYRHSVIKVPEPGRLVNTLFSTNDFDDAFGAKFGYRVNEKFMPYLRGQTTFVDRDKTNNQVGAGIEAKVLDKATLTLEENFGNIGDSTQLRFETQVAEGTTTYANIASGNERGYGPGVRTTLGSSHTLDDRSRLFSEKEYSAYRGDNYARNIMGYEKTFFDNRLGGIFTVERNELDRAKESGVTFVDIPVLTNAYSAGLTYSEGDFLSASTKLEYRRFSVNAASDNQWLSYNNLDVHLSKDLEFFTRYNLSRSRDLGNQNTLADFVEMNTGFAYRPVEWDRFHALTRYTFLDDNLPDNRFEGGLPLEDYAHIFAIEGAYDFNRYFELVEKFAYKLSAVESAFTGALRVYNYLILSRVNFHVTRKWDLGLEYRILTQQGAGQNLKNGVLVELDRELFDYTRIGVGYNFTDFDDDLRTSNSYRSTSQGPFVRMTGKF